MPAAAKRRDLDAVKAKIAVSDSVKTDQHQLNIDDFDCDKQLKFIGDSVPAYSPAIHVDYQGFSLRDPKMQEWSLVRLFLYLI